ncbi:MAG: enoyl-CoA hydratase/isomerase family protein [Chloroflexi bacterium]|nr:enoyl-CoA hydratase/isomerase family protein [Chloroflexota bacterium]
MNPSSGVVLSIDAAQIGILKVHRPQVRNALSWEAMQAFSDAVETARKANLRALIVTGGGQAFIAGGDLKQLADYPTEDDGRRMSRLMTRALHNLEALPFPTIAAINGPARGGGSEVALACDLRIMAENADLGFVQVAWYVTPGWGMGQRLLRLVGYSRALEWLLTGKVLSPQEALEHGLANRVVPKGQALDAARALAQEIASLPPAVAQSIKEVLRAGVTLPPATAAKVEHDLFPPLWAADEHVEAVLRFKQRSRKSPSD